MSTPENAPTPERTEYLTDAELEARFSGPGGIRLSRRQIADLGREPGCPAIDIGTGNYCHRRWPLAETEAWLRKRSERRRARRPVANVTIKIESTPKLPSPPSNMTTGRVGVDALVSMKQPGR